MLQKEGFDFLDADGGFGRADDTICDYLASRAALRTHQGRAQECRDGANQAGGEKLGLPAPTFLRSAKSKAEFRHVVLDRKGAIATGKGHVNPAKLDSSTHGI